MRSQKPISKRMIAAVHNFNARAYGKTAPEIPKARAPSRDLEHKEQVAVIQWWHLAHKGFGLPEFALFAIPNGGHRHMLTAVRLKAEGVRKGVSDLCLPVQRGGYGGAYIEMKATAGSESDDQQEFINFVRSQNYKAHFCYGADEAIEFITSYLRG
jgi:hypothetical protein